MRASWLMSMAVAVASGGTPALVSAVWSWASDRNGIPGASWTLACALHRSGIAGFRSTP